MNDAEKAHNPLSRKLGRATLKISTSIYERNLKYFLDKGIFVLPSRYINTKTINGINEDKIVAYDAPLTPKFKLKIKIGSNIIFKIFGSTQLIALIFNAFIALFTAILLFSFTNILFQLLLS